MVNWDGAGNLPPQRALARELLRRGHDVHVLTHDSVSDLMGSDGVVFHRLATAYQYASSLRLTVEEEDVLLGAEVGGSAAFARDFLDVAERLRPEVFLVDAGLLSVLYAARLRPPVSVRPSDTETGDRPGWTQGMGRRLRLALEREPTTMRSLILTAFALALIAGAADAAQQSTLTTTRVDQQSTLTTTKVDDTPYVILAKLNRRPPIAHCEPWPRCEPKACTRKHVPKWCY